jgi:hypothetical protein
MIFLQLEPIPNHWVKAASITEYAEGCFSVSVVTIYRSSFECFLSLRAAKVYFGRNYFPGAKWKKVDAPTVTE